MTTMRTLSHVSYSLNPSKGEGKGATCGTCSWPNISIVLAVCKKRYWLGWPLGYLNISLIGFIRTLYANIFQRVPEDDQVGGWKRSWKLLEIIGGGKRGNPLLPCLQTSNFYHYYIIIPFVIRITTPPMIAINTMSTMKITVPYP